MGIKDDVATLCANAPDAVDVSWGAYCSRGPLDAEDGSEFDGNGLAVRTRRIEIRIPTHHLPGIPRGATVRVTQDGVRTDYRVRDVLLAEDGREKDLTLTVA